MLFNVQIQSSTFSRGHQTPTIKRGNLDASHTFFVLGSLCAIRAYTQALQLLCALMSTNKFKRINLSTCILSNSITNVL